MLTGIGTIGGAIAVGLTLWVGRNALTKYREQKKADKQIDVAVSIVATAHQLRSALSHIRNTFSKGGYDQYEAATHLKSVGIDPTADRPLFERMISTRMIHLRAAKFAPLFERAQEVLATAKAYFSETNVPEKFRGLAECYTNILVFADGYPDCGAREDRISIATMEFIFAGITSGSPDKFAAELDESMSEIERVLIRVIRPERKPLWAAR